MTEPEVNALKLHPMTLLQRVILSLPGYVALLFATWTSPDEGNLVSLIVTVLYAVIALPIIYLRYARFRYWITDTELVIKSGVLTRQHRNIPLDKIQNVEILQRLLPRITGTAQVQVVTAGSAGAEGVLQFVSLKEAHRIREVVRRYNREPGDAAFRLARADDQATTTQTGEELGGQPAGHTSSLQPSELLSGQRHAAVGEFEEREPLFSMNIRRVLLSGAFRFSLLYIALIFSALQFFQPDPEKLLTWILRSSYEPFIRTLQDSPLTSAILGIGGAAVLSWLSGIAVNFNKYFGFRLWKEGTKIGKRSGLMTLAEGTIPLRKIQAILFETNPIRELAGFNALRVQTMGLDPNEAGHRVVVPFARLAETDSIARRVVPWTMPDKYNAVSKKRILRLFVRYTLSLIAVIGVLAIWYPQAVWLIFLAPLLLLLAYHQWKRHGFSFTGDALGVRRGVIKRRTWIIPISKMQVFYTTDSFFQRRRGLKSVYVDSAGASSMSRPVIIDLEKNTADNLVRELYSRFRQER